VRSGTGKHGKHAMANNMQVIVPGIVLLTINLPGMTMDQRAWIYYPGHAPLDAWCL
jgi:hypothetical protein